MSAGSSRIRVPVDLHQHEDPPGPGTDGARPDGRDDDCCRSVEGHVGRLWRENGALLFQDAAGGEPVAVRLAWARPLSERGGPVSVMQAGKKRELAYLRNLDELPDESRRVALEALEEGMVMPAIREIRRVRPRFGNYYWDVETDMGRRTFLMLSPENNVFRPEPDRVVLRDVSGNCYEIGSISGLSGASRREMERVL